jgi:hypothetical protein
MQTLDTLTLANPLRPADYQGFFAFGKIDGKLETSFAKTLRDAFFAGKLRLLLPWEEALLKKAHSL